MSPLTHRSKIAFTLIELLIVVAIIAILAAIAVPNFLEAQTRAKVSRSLADMRSVASAIEQYRVDNNKFPLSAVDSPFGDTWLVANYRHTIYVQLSTPVAYISTFPIDAWKGDTAYTYNPTDTRNLYDYRRTVRTEVGGRTTIEAVQSGSTFPHRRFDDPTSWLLFSPGPDKRGDINNDLIISTNARPLPEWPFYDPTNGTVSKGDIIRAMEGDNDSLAGL